MGLTLRLSARITKDPLTGTLRALILTSAGVPSRKHGILFLVVLEFELRASGLLGRLSIA
jgi:hypothetical protein